jgi:hypothetical protein
MSFEDDEYWEDEYDQYSLMPNTAVVQERHYAKRTEPDPVIPTRRRGSGPAPDGPVDELAERRQRRATGNVPAQPGRRRVRRRRLQPARAGRRFRRPGLPDRLGAAA